MSKIKKIMLAQSNMRWSGLKPWHTFPYTLGLLSAILKDKYDVKILDANLEDLTPEQVKSRIKEYKPDVVGVTCMSMEYEKDFRIITSLAKEVNPEILVFRGGIFPTLLPEIVMRDKNTDYLIIGEAECRLLKLLEYLENKKSLKDIDGVAYRENGKVVIQNMTGFVQNLDEVPFPYYDNIDFFSYANKATKYSAYVYPKKFPYAFSMTSRGCPFNCTFCSSKSINGPTIRYRSPESVLKEVDWLVKKYGVKEIIFLDDNFFLDRERLIKILNGLIERNYDLSWKTTNIAVYALDDEILELMWKSGCYQIFLAVESGTKEGLSLINKPFPEKILKNSKHIVDKAKSLGFDVGAMYVIGSPGETWEQIRQTIKFAEYLDTDYASFNIATPLPKTKLYKTAKEQNLLPPDFDFNAEDFKGFGKGTITTNEFTPEELQILRAFEWDRINFKTPEKQAKIARMNGLTLDEVKEWRVSTRRGVGIKTTYKGFA